MIFRIAKNINLLRTGRDLSSLASMESVKKAGGLVKFHSVNFTRECVMRGKNFTDVTLDMAYKSASNGNFLDARFRCFIVRIFTKRKAESYVTSGYVNYMMKNNAKALSYFKKALVINPSLKDNITAIIRSIENAQ
jgi:hypothetical protein